MWRLSDGERGLEYIKWKEANPNDTRLSTPYSTWDEWQLQAQLKHIAEELLKSGYWTSDPHPDRFGKVFMVNAKSMQSLLAEGKEVEDGT